MNKTKQLILAIFVWLVLPTRVFGAENLVIKVFEPKSPTNVDNFKLNFVALDTNNSPITVKCFKQSPSESSFSQFDGDKVLKLGGNSGYCSVTGSILSTEGNFKFYVEANGIKSNEVTVDYNTSTPGTPNSYNKDKVNSCDYKIKVKTDNDDGKTAKVVLYRSDSLSFSADSGTQVDSRNVGSDTWVEMTNSVPDCNKTYYYAVRAFNNAGNGSAIIGDENIVTTYSTILTTQNSETNIPTRNQALSVENSSVVNPETSPIKNKNLEISVTPSTSPEILGSATKEPFWRTKPFRIGVIVVLVGLFIANRKRKK